jgi:hypothetical protein
MVVGNPEVKKPLGRLDTDWKAVNIYHTGSLLENLA